MKQPKTTTVAAAAAKKTSRRSFPTGDATTGSGRATVSVATRRQSNAPAGNGKGKAVSATATPVSGGGTVASGRVGKKKSVISRGRRRISGTVSASAPSGSVSGKGGGKGKSKASSKRKAAPIHDEEEEEEEEEEGEDFMDVDSDSDHDLYPVLLPHKLRVPLHTVDTKWTHLPPPSQSLITTFLTTIESSVLSTFTSERRRLEAHTTLRNVKRKLVSQLPKIPVPAIPMKDLGFDLPKLQEMNRGIEAQVRPEIAQISTLDREINDLRRLVEVKRGQLSELKRNEKSEEVLRRGRVGRVIEVLRRPLTEVEERFRGDNVGVVDGSMKDGGERNSTYDPSNDPEVVELKRRLESHLGSVAANLKPLEGFGERIYGVRGVVEEVLGRMGGEVVNEVMEV